MQIDLRFKNIRKCVKQTVLESKTVTYKKIIREIWIYSKSNTVILRVIQNILHSGTSWYASKTRHFSIALITNTYQKDTAADTAPKSIVIKIQLIQPFLKETRF